jgi:hypothetical protein
MSRPTWLPRFQLYKRHNNNNHFRSRHLRNRLLFNPWHHLRKSKQKRPVCLSSISNLPDKTPHLLVLLLEKEWMIGGEFKTKSIGA